MSDTTSTIHPVIQLVALGSLQIAMRLLEDFDPAQPAIEQAMVVPHPLLIGINRVPVLMPQIIHLNGIDVRCVIMTFSKSDDELKVDHTVAPKPVAMVAQIVAANGAKMIGINRWTEDENLDEQELEFVHALEQVHDTMLATFGAGELDEETKAILQAA